MQEIFQFIDGKKEDLIGLTRSLVAIPTVNPPGENYERIVTLLEKRCAALGCRTRRIVTPRAYLEKRGIRGGSKRISLLADLRTGASRTVHLNGHYDVVPVSTQWKTDPFRPVLKAGAIYGRGTEDMKGTIAAMLIAVAAVRQCWIAPNVNIQLSFTPDEEIGGETGFGWLVKKGLVKADCAMSEGYSNAVVACGNKGIVWAEITVKGKAAHASVPYKGVNAFEYAALLVRRLCALRDEIGQRVTGWDVCSLEDKHPSLVLGGIVRGGAKTNVVPDRVTFSVDRRVLPEETIAQAKQEIQDVVAAFCREHPAVRATVSFTSVHPPVCIDRQSRICHSVEQAIRAVYNRPAQFALLPGGTDMRYLIQKGVPAVGYSACGGGRWHGDNEYVTVRSLLATAKVYALTIMNL